jgi:glycine cleavage system H protein
MATPTDRRYSKTHEWIKLEGTFALVGITEHAQEALGDITFVELPKIGVNVKKDGACGVIESVKAASDLNAPVSGQIAEVNRALESAPETINSDPYEAGWILKLANTTGAEMASLMDSVAYDLFVESEQ